MEVGACSCQGLLWVLSEFLVVVELLNGNRNPEAAR